jgi:general secretion pathway protein L
MRDGLLIRWRGVGEAVEWLRIEGGRIGLVQREAAPPPAVLAKAAHVAVLVPGEDVLCVGLDLPARKVEAARKAAAFAAEEQVAAPIESLQVALGDAARDGRWPCAVIARSKLAALQADLAARGIQPDAVHADAACLAVGQALREEERVLARVDGERAFACAATLWPQLAARAGVEPEQVDALLPALAESLRSANPVNLLQGEHASAHRGADALRWWKLAAALALVALVLSTAWIQLDAWRLQARLAALNAAMVKVYQERFPDAKRVPNPRLMLEHALRQAGASGTQQDSGLGLLAKAAPVLSAQSQVTLDGADYRSGQLELRLTAADIGALDSLRERLAASLGVAVTLANATAREGQVEGRLVVGGAR